MFSNRLLSTVLTLSGCMTATLPALAVSATTDSAADTSAAPASFSTAVPSPAAPAPGAFETRFDRWVDLKEMDFSLRYRSTFDSNNAHEYNQGQQRSIIDGKFQFDEEGRYGVVFHASTGRYFNWAYADFIGGGNEAGFDREFAKATPAQQVAIAAYEGPQQDFDQIHSGGWSFYLRRLYLDVEPIKGIEGQWGSLDINRGAASEITTYDNDGYIDGGRILVKRPKSLFFDEASITYAYFGDLYTPNFLARGERLTQSNYHQFLLRKRVSSRVDASVDYTWQDASNTYREAAYVKVPEARIVDAVRAEFYERTNEISFRGVQDFVPGKNGYAFTGFKKDIFHRVDLDAGYAHIDQHQAVLTQSESAATLTMGVNGDSYGMGNRYFVHPTIKLSSCVYATGFYTHLIGTFDIPDQILWNKQNLNAGLVFDIKKALFPKKEAY